MPLGETLGLRRVCSDSQSACCISSPPRHPPPPFTPSSASHEASKPLHVHASVLASDRIATVDPSRHPSVEADRPPTSARESARCANPRLELKQTPNTTRIVYLHRNLVVCRHPPTRRWSLQIVIPPSPNDLAGAQQRGTLCQHQDYIRSTYNAMSIWWSECYGISYIQGTSICPEGATVPRMVA